MSSLNSTTKLFSDSGQSCYDSVRTDSGFLSGANLVSEENLSSEDLSATERSLSSLDGKSHKSHDCYMRLDSGVDISLNEQFSDLTLQQKPVVNNLFQSAISKQLGCSDIKITSNLCSNSKEEKPNEELTEPWMLYFQQDEEGDTQLHIAIIQGFIEVVYSLTSMVPHPCFLDLQNDVVQSPLHLAVLTHQPRIVRRLVVAGARIEIRDRHGNTPLHIACQTGDIECVKALTEPISISEVSNANLRYTGCRHQVPQEFEERNYDGETCLHLAAYGGHLDILRHLIWFGANINSREDKSGKTILHYAVETLNYKLLRFLFDECSFGPNGLKVDTSNYAGHTAYQIACLIDGKIANELVSRGADTTVEDLDEEDDEHPDHNSCDEEINDIVQAGIGNYLTSRKALHL